jgi:hypothetical protein
VAAGLTHRVPGPADWDTHCDPWQLHPRRRTGRLDAEPCKNPGYRPCEYYWDRQPQGSAKQCRVNLSGDDDIRNQRERGGNQHGPLAWIVGISDCDLIHVVEVTGALSILGRVAVETNHVEAEGKGQPLYGPGSSGGYPKAGGLGHLQSAMTCERS